MASYLIPEPTESISGKSYTGSLLFTNNNKKYYALKLNPDAHTEKWWAIGMIARMGGWYKPIVVSTVQDYASTMSDDENRPYRASISFEYDGVQYYVSSYTSALQSFSGSQNIPTCETTYSVADTDSSMTEAGKKLIDLYVADGGELPEREKDPQKYLLSEPTAETSKVLALGTRKGLGNLLISQNAEQYSFKPDGSTEEWWAIGMIAHNGNYWHPLIVSNTKEYSYSFSTKYYPNNDPLSNNTASFEYEGKIYHASFGAFGSTGNSSVLTSAKIPVYTATKSTNIEEMAKILIGLHLAEGGTLPGKKSAFEPMEYETIGWKNDGPPDISAENLGKMDETIGKLCTNLNIAHEELEADIQELAETIGAITTTQF